MNYTIGKTLYENFGPFARVAFDFSAPGLTAIEGEINKTGCDSNGAGKSKLFDGLSWCLTGECMSPGMSADDVVRNGSKGGAMVQTTLHGEHEVVVTRTRGHTVHGTKTMLYVDGQDATAGTNAQTDAMIVGLIGLDFTAFCNSVAFGARVDVSSFFTATDADRKKLLEGMLGLDRFSRALNVAKERYREVGAQLNALEAKRDRLSDLIDERQRVLADLSRGEDDEGVARTRQLEAEAMSLRYRRLMSKQQDYIDTVEDRKQAVVGAANKVLEQYHAAVAQWSVEEQDAQGNVQEAIREVAKAESSYSGAKTTLDRLEKLTGGTCPTCTQPVQGKAHKAAVKAAAKAVADAAHREDMAKGDLTLARKALAAVQSRRPVRPGGVHARMAGVVVEAAYETLGWYETQAKAWEARQQGGTQDAARASQRDRMAKDIEAAKEQLAEVEGAIESQQVEAEQVEFWVNGFGKQGLVSFLMEAAMPQINERATAYAVALLGEDATVKLSATTTLRSSAAVREKISVIGRIPGCCTSYAQASKGQKRRMNLALILAFRDFVSGRSAAPFGQMLMDEILDGMDRTGVEAVAELARDLSTEHPVVLITHDPALKGVADRVVRVVHDGTVAHLEGPGTEWPDQIKTARTQRRAPKKKKAVIAG